MNISVNSAMLSNPKPERMLIGSPTFFYQCCCWWFKISVKDGWVKRYYYYNNLLFYLPTNRISLTIFIKSILTTIDTLSLDELSQVITRSRQEKALGRFDRVDGYKHEDWSKDNWSNEPWKTFSRLFFSKFYLTKSTYTPMPIIQKSNSFQLTNWF